MILGYSFAKIKRVHLILGENEKSLLKLYLFYGILGLQMLLKPYKKTKCCLRKKKEEDIYFYEDQRNARKGVIGGKDALFQKSLRKRQERRAHLTVAPVSSSDESERDIDLCSQVSSSSLHSISSAGYESNENASPSSQSNFVTLNVPKNLINNPEITEVLDWLKISDNAATMLVASFIKACQGNIDDFCLSRSSTHRARIANRLQISNEITTDITEAPSDFLALHWDAKLT